MDSDGSNHSEKKAPQLLEDDVDVAAFVASPEVRLDPQVAARLRFVEAARQLRGDLTSLVIRRKIDWNLMPLMCRKFQRLLYYRTQGVSVGQLCICEKCADRHGALSSECCQHDLCGQGRSRTSRCLGNYVSCGPLNFAPFLTWDHSAVALN